MFTSKSSIVPYVCGSEIGNWSGISDLCKNKNWTQPVIHVQPILEEGVQLAEYISGANFEIINKLRDGKMSLFDLTTHIARSQIESSAKNQLLEKIEEAADDAQSTSRGMHTMFAGFARVLDGIESYAKRMHRHLKRQDSFLSRWWKSNGTELEIDRQSFEKDLEELDTEVKIVANNTDKVNSMLGMYVSR